MSLSEWANKHFYLSSESSNIPGRWETLPYQKTIMDCISNDDIRVVTWKKAARVGYTKIITAAVGYFAEHKKRNQVLYQPTDSDAEDFCKDEIDPMLRDVPVVKKSLLTDPDKKSKYNTLSKKSFHGSVLDIKGGSSGRNYRRLTKDVVYYDECDGFDKNIDNEGSCLILGDRRVQNSPFRKSIRGSTPKETETSLIEQSADSADVLLERYLPCPYCGEYHPLKWKNLLWDEDAKIVSHVCVSCGTEVSYSDYAEMDRNGRWQSDTGVHVNDQTGLFYDDTGTLIDPPRHVAFWCSGLYSYYVTWQSHVLEFIAANNAKKKGKIESLISFVNTVLAESWHEKGEQVPSHQLYKRREYYKAQVPDDVLVLTAGVDVHDDRFEFEVTGWGSHEQSWAIDYVKIYGDPSKPQIWKKLYNRLNVQYEDEDGTLHGTQLICIDSGGHYTDEVYDFSKRHGLLRYIPIKGANKLGKPIATFPKKRNKKGVYLTEVGTDTTKDLLFHRLKILEPGPGYCHYPVKDCFDEEYFKQLTTQERRKTYKKGELIYEWVKANGERDEPWDCKRYSLAAIRILQQYSGVNLEQLARDKERSADDEVKEQEPERRTRVIKSKYLES